MFLSLMNYQAMGRKFDETPLDHFQFCLLNLCVAAMKDGLVLRDICVDFQTKNKQNNIKN